MALKKITDKDLAGKGVVGMADVPGLSAREMQQKVEEILRDVVIPVLNENIDKTATIEDLGHAVFNAGAGDMSTYIYDRDNDGRVDDAANGFSVYGHRKNGTVHTLTGTGDNIKFIPSDDWTSGDSLIINGLPAFPYSQLAENIAEEEIFKKHTIVSCFLSKHESGDRYNVFFNLGGAGLNFKITGGITPPASPKENTLWINTGMTVGEYQFSVTQPENRADGKALQAGDVWLVTGTEGNISFNALKKNGINVKVISAYQYNGTAWNEKVIKGYINGMWADNDIYIFSSTNGINKGMWTVADGTVDISESEILVSGESYEYTYAVCDEGIDVTTLNTVFFNVDSFYKNDSDANYHYVGLCTEIAANDKFALKVMVGGIGEYIIDTSALSGIYYPKIQVHSLGHDDGYVSYIGVNEIRYTARKTGVTG